MVQKYCVILGDVVNSRRIEDRETFRETLQSTLASVNDDFEESIHAPFAVLKGVDEIGGVLKSVPPVVEIQRRLTRALHPQQIRLAAVVGEIDVNTATGDVAAMDGEAFARADSILADLEGEDLTFRLDGIVSVVDELVSDEINLLDVIRSEWTERQAEIVSKYDELDSQAAVAESLDITPQAVSNALSKTNGQQLLLVERRLSRTVEGYPNLETEETAR